MKFLKKISLLIIMFSLASCENVFNSSKNSFISSSSSSINKNESTNSSILDKNTTSTNTASSSIDIISSSTSSSINNSSSSTISNSPISSSTPVISAPSSSSSTIIEDTGPKLIDIYATNDLHGRISSGTSYVPGIARLSTYLKQKKAENQDGFIYINSGDYWQDTYESGYNKGKLLTECLDILECETLTYGNHEFDWGIDIIKENLQYTSYTTFLGANIREYPNTSKQVDFAEPYKIVERDGLKIGIIGAIGKGQITSITSSNWEDITFLDHAPIVKELSDELRSEKDCDIVILSIHADEADSAGSEITKVSPVTNKKYVDAVFCAHSHQREIKYYNEVPFVQAGQHGQNLSHVTLQYHEGEVEVLKAEHEHGFRTMSQCFPDPEIEDIINKYFTEEYFNDKDKVHGTISGSGSMDKATSGNLLAKATYEKLQEEGVEVDIVINNGSRDSVSVGTMTSEKIFNMIPFTNKTIVARNIKGQDIINECVNYTNYYYMPDPTLKINSNSYYTVACIDYLLLHKGTNRNYNYFSSYKESNVIYTIEEYCNSIVEWYLQKHGTVAKTDFSGTNYNCLK